METALFPALVRALLVVLVGVVLYVVARRTLTRLHAGGRLSTNGEFVARTGLKWLLGIAIILGVVGQFGISPASLWTAVSAVFVLVAVGFVAIWSVLSNMLCAVVLVFFAPFRIGDRIEIIELTLNDGTKTGLRGRVVGIDLMFTTLADDVNGGSTLRIPNNMLFQRAIRTIHGDDTRSLGSELFSPETGRPREPVPSAPAAREDDGA